MSLGLLGAYCLTLGLSNNKGTGYTILCVVLAFGKSEHGRWFLVNLGIRFSLLNSYDLLKSYVVAVETYEFARNPKDRSPP